MNLPFITATEAHAGALASLRAAVDEDLRLNHGQSYWSSSVSEKKALRDIQNSRVLIVLNGGRITASLRLTTKKPWAIDLNCFTSVDRPLYLHDMAVHPAWQRRGMGSYLMEQAVMVAREWPGDSIRLDAYDGPPGAGNFYLKCGFREVGRASYRGVPLIYYELPL
jgi:GNAT superfamily N-acetyltransferase